MKTRFAIALTSALLGGAFFAHAQSSIDQLHSAILRSEKANGLTPADLADARLDRSVPNQKTGHTYHYLQQTLQEVPVYGATMVIVASPDGDLVHFNDTFIRGVVRYGASTDPSVSPENALANALRHVEVPGAVPPLLNRPEGPTQRGSFERGDVALDEITFSLVLMPVESGLHLTWEFLVKTTDTQHWWNVFVDAASEEVLLVNDWVIKCQWDDHAHNAACMPEIKGRNPMLMPATSAPSSPPLNGSSYRVFPEPLRSPYDGPRSLISEPWMANLAASPFGWHDTNGSPGPEYTITRGNNVWAKEDRNGDNGIGFSPDGGPGLTFDFPLDLSQQPVTYQDAAITNLFYWNNLLHDILYNYGFDEASGNFQENNYGNGGLGNDFVFADAQDGSAVNNATFSTPPDGQNPRMQMFEWTTVAVPIFLANGVSYPSVTAAFGPQTADLNAELALYLDGPSGPSLACTAPSNPGALSGRIALVDRGDCNFTLKVLNAQNAGALAVVVVQNTNEAPFSMGGNEPAVTIPSVMVSQATGNTLKALLQQGAVNLVLNLPSSVNRDSDLDNEIIAHEYGHGLSIRLTAGADNVSCLFNNEQMGEGWSDYLSLIVAMNPADQPADARGIANYSLGDGPSGPGIRPFPYSFDMGVNPVTYDYISFLSVPHGVGSVWCSMLWDMTWLLIDEHGFDPDLYNGQGGNNIALQLVVEGLKLQPCSPGFVDGRDAILLADQILYGGANQCLIWEAFARRGLGVNASQGSSGSTQDGVESYGLGGPCNLNIEKLAQAAMGAGSTTEVTLLVANNSGNLATNVVVTDVIPAEVSYVPGSASCDVNVTGNTLTFSLGTLADGDSVLCTYSIEAPPTPFTTFSFFDDVEAGDGEFSTSSGVGNVLWERTNARAFSPITSWFAVNPTFEADFYLVLDGVDQITSGTFLSFRHFYSTEQNWDGCVVEYSTNGGSTWQDAGPLMTQNGYNGTINVSQSSAISGRSAFTGGSPGFIETIVNLASLAGQTIDVRFRLASDFIIGGDGWYIDDIFIGESLVQFVNEACVTSDQTGTLCASAQTTIFETIPCVGDFNNDALINAADLLMLLGEYGCMSGCATDLTGDGAVGVADVVLFLPLFGTICP